MSISILDNLESVTSASAAAVIAVVPTNTCSVHSSGSSDRELDPARADALVGRLLGITAGGPIAFIVTHNDEAWAESFQRHGLTTTTGLYVLGSFGVIIGSAGPTSAMPIDTFLSVGSLVQAITTRVSKRGDTVVIPFAFSPIASIAVASMDRNAIAVAESATHALYLRTALSADVQTDELNDEQYADVLRRLGDGESASGIARSLGIVGDRLCRRLEKDGIRAHRKRGRAKAAATV